MNSPALRGVQVSAPGKLVVLGEYSVLRGAPSLAMAVERRALVTLRWIEGRDSVIESNLWPGRKIPFNPDTPSVFEPTDPESARALTFLQHVFSWFRDREGPLCRDSAQAVHLELDTRDFYFGSAKLGLGSSAALTVALFAAIRAFQAGVDVHWTPEQMWPELWRMYRHQPGQQGSGIDIAVSCFGRWIQYQNDPNREAPTLEVLAREAPCPLLIVWTGHAVATSDMLKRFFEWEKEDPRGFRKMMECLGSISEAGIQAFRRGISGPFCLAVDEYAKGLRELGEMSGLEILSEAHDRLWALAQSLGASYKPSGAGGGDVGFVVAESQEALSIFRQEASAMGYHIVDTNQEAKGLEIRPILE